MVARSGASLAGRARARPLLSFVNGIFAIDAAAYRRYGGHAVVAGEILEDMEFARGCHPGGREVLDGGGNSPGVVPDV